MIVKGRSPTMRHASRTHRVALERLLDRINLDPNIQLKHVDTKNQLADMLTKGNFTRDSWDHLLRWLYIMNFSMFSCSHFLSNRKQSVMSKRAQERGTEEGPSEAKPRSAYFWFHKQKTNVPGNPELNSNSVFREHKVNATRAIVPCARAQTGISASFLLLLF